jgi:hypothetical protein
MESASYWLNEWSALSQAPHLVVISIVVIVAVVAKLTLSLSRWLYSSGIDNEVFGQRPEAHEQIQPMTAEHLRERDWPDSAIEYHGEAGIPRSCQVAVVRLLQCRETLLRARIVSFFDPESPSDHDSGQFQGDHGILFTIDEHDGLIAIKQGFASGYYGEGPRTFAFVLALLEAHKIPIEEYEVDKGFIDRLNKCRLTNEDIKKLDPTERRWPVRWYGYMTAFERYNHFRESARDGTLWQEFPEIIPFCIIDSRIVDLALTFWEDPAARIFTGYIRLEDIVRERTGLTVGSYKLFEAAFRGGRPKPRLYWNVVDTAERDGRTNLFTGAYMAHRNSRAHSELRSHESVTEFLLLNHLYLLEREARRIARDDHDPCGAIRPDLPKVV